MGPYRDKKNVLVLVASFLAVIGLLQIVGCGRIMLQGSGGGSTRWRLKPTADDPEGRACISHVCVYFDVTFAKEPVGRTIFLLYEKKVLVSTIPSFQCRSDVFLHWLDCWWRYWGDKVLLEVLSICMWLNWIERNHHENWLFWGYEVLGLQNEVWVSELRILPDELTNLQHCFWIFQAPRTAENFRSLATGERGINANGINLHYKNTTFHRVVHGLLVVGGNIMSKYISFLFFFF